jgi:WD40 repeat protein
MFAAATASTHPVTHLAFDPAGATLAVAQPNYGITLLDRATGRPVRTLPLPRVAGYRSVAFGAGGARLAVGSLKGVHVFDAATGDVLGHQGGRLLGGAVAAETGDGLVVAAGGGLWGVRLPGTAPADPLRWSARPLQSRAAVVALSPCGRWGFGVYERVRPALLDLRTGRVAVALDHRYRLGGRGGAAVAFSADGGRVAVCDGTDVAVFDTPTPPAADEPDDEPPPAPTVAPKPRALVGPVLVLDGPSGAPAFTPGGRGLLVRRPRNRVQLWDVAAAARVAEWGWRLDSVLCLAVAPDGLTAAAGARFGRLVAWDLE